jgi:uncharacterized protein (TIGR00661 family)
MARIFYSMAGEGRGHAVRVRTLVEHLKHDHELHLFAPEDAFEFLQTFYGPGSPDPQVGLARIPGLRFQYTGEKLNLAKSIGRGLKYAARELPRLVRAFRLRIRAERPDLILSDFEPSLPRAARRERVPFLSVDHQHVLVACDLSALSKELRWYAWWMGWAIRWHDAGRCRGVMTAFYQLPVKPGFEDLQLVGPIIRPEVAALKPSSGDYLLSYLRKITPERVVDVLAQAPCPVRIYGLGERSSRANLTFHPIHEQTFIDDLAGCRGVVCAAGNQLLGEALYLGKPVLAIPEEIHHEQRINACFLRDMGAGDWTTLEQFDGRKLESFLERLPEYQAVAANLCGRLDGTTDALNLIRAELEHAAPTQLARAGNRNDALL